MTDSERFDLTHRAHCGTSTPEDVVALLAVITELEAEVAAREADYRAGYNTGHLAGFTAAMEMRTAAST